MCHGISHQCNLQISLWNMWKKQPSQTPHTVLAGGSDMWMTVMPVYRNNIYKNFTPPLTLSNLTFSSPLKPKRKTAFLFQTRSPLEGMDEFKQRCIEKTTHTKKYLDLGSHHPANHKYPLRSLQPTQESVRNGNTFSKCQRIIVIPAASLRSVILKEIIQSTFFLQRYVCQEPVVRKELRCSTLHQRNLSKALQSPKKLRRRGRLQAYPNTTPALPTPKDRVSPHETRGVIYKIHCKTCDFVYYGQTGRAVNTRVYTEHLNKQFENFDRNSKIAKHLYEHDHSMDFENNATVSTKPGIIHERLFLEAWYKTVWSSSVFLTREQGTPVDRKDYGFYKLKRLSLA